MVSVELADPCSPSAEALRRKLSPEGNGYHSGLVAEAAPGLHYRFKVSEGLFPDPASRFQPEGPHGPSEIVDPASYPWRDKDWTGIPPAGQIVYEMHIGTFTPAGTWRGAISELPAVRELGATILEVMPVAEFPGKFGWGYDGVNLFAPYHVYGRPDDFRAFVDASHSLGLAVILDVVYNHLGPDGNYLRPFSPDYFSSRYKNEWGEAINFDGENSGPVREFFAENAAYWIDEFHLDGLRLDATQQIFDSSEENVQRLITRTARAAAPKRRLFIVAENETQDARLARAANLDGYGMDALWNDDFHHSAFVALTRRNEAYYSDHKGSPQEFISAAKWGFLFQGQRYAWQKARRGSPALDLEPHQFVNFLQNHDQIANSLRGRRGHQSTSPSLWRAMTGLLLLGPGTPMLFQGQEFAASTGFQFFADHQPELARLVRQGRKEFLSQFPSISCPESEPCLVDPSSEAAFESSKLDPTERSRHTEAYRLHRDLLALRSGEISIQSVRRSGLDGAVLSSEAFVLRYFVRDGDDRMLVVNLGLDLHLESAPEPLLAPPQGRAWRLRWSSEDPDYGGGGTPPVDVDGSWRVPGQCTVFLAAQIE
jgi:maltooligosyltrehalose trehalohydrolase